MNFQILQFLFSVVFKKNFYCQNFSLDFLQRYIITSSDTKLRSLMILSKDPGYSHTEMQLQVVQLSLQIDSVFSKKAMLKQVS